MNKTIKYKRLMRRLRRHAKKNPDEKELCITLMIDFATARIVGYAPRIRCSTVFVYNIDHKYYNRNIKSKVLQRILIKYFFNGNKYCAHVNKIKQGEIYGT